jgi:uncharacterized sulfatase
MREKIQAFLTQYIGITFRLIFVFLSIRFLEFFYIRFYIQAPVTADGLFTRSINFDSLFILLYSVTLGLPLILLSLFYFNVSIQLAKASAFMLVFINLGLTQYFLTNHTLLTGQFFEFSFVETKNIILNELSIGRLHFWITLVAILILTAYLLYFKKYTAHKTLQRFFGFSYILALIVSLVNCNHVFKDLKYFDSNYAYLVGNSKITYFIKSYYAKKEKESEFHFFDPAKVKECSKAVREQYPQFNYTDTDFPFVHNEAYQNVLGPFFKESVNKPNIVLIISESLSSSFSGKKTSLGSLTPFTDSLANVGLSWQNFLSNAPRTYGAIPDILASLPLCVNERGFINTQVEYPQHKKYPVHTTIIDLLKQNGYVCNYYYGGWGYFDNVGFYLREKNITHFVCESDFDKTKYRIKNGLTTGQIWGYNDKALFNQSLDLFETHTLNKPFLNVFQTISNHSPFNLSEDIYYSDAFLEKRYAALGLSKSLETKIDKKIISSIFFADDALKEYFNRMQTHQEFENTIFIITGDHAIDLNIDSSPLKNYRVPLIVYSPLLKKAQTFSGLCSHIDILPSLLGLLEKNYGLKFPAEKQWIGEGLDTSLIFKAKRNIPLNMLSMDMPNFIYKNYLLQGENIYELDSSLQTSTETNQKKAKEIKNHIHNFYYLNNYVCLKNKIWQ